MCILYYIYHLDAAVDRVEGRTGVEPVILGPEGLPMLDPVTKKAPPQLAELYGDYIRPGHGFAQVFPEHKFLIVQVCNMYHNNRHNYTPYTD
jgi:hypothetical protein